VEWDDCGWTFVYLSLDLYKSMYQTKPRHANAMQCWSYARSSKVAFIPSFSGPCVRSSVSACSLLPTLRGWLVFGLCLFKHNSHCYCYLVVVAPVFPF